MRTEQLPPELEGAIDVPFGGLFGNSVMVRVLYEIVSDPYTTYHTKELMQLTEATQPSVSKALNDLVDLGILKKDQRDKQHPSYEPVLSSKRLQSLTLLLYAIGDENGGGRSYADALIESTEHSINDQGGIDKDGYLLVRVSKEVNGFIASKVESGQYTSPDELVRSGLRQMMQTDIEHRLKANGIDIDSLHA